MEIEKNIVRAEYPSAEWEVVLTSSKSYSLQSDNKDFGTPAFRNTNSVICRAILPGRKVGVSAASNMSKVKECLLDACKVASAATPKKIVPSISPHLTFSKNIDNFRDFNPERMFSMLKGIKAAVEEKAPFLFSQIYKSNNKLDYFNSNGSHLSFGNSGIGAFLNIGKDFRVGNSSYHSCTAMPDFERFVGEALMQYDYSKNAVKGCKGTYDVLFTPEALSAVLQPVLFSLLGESLVEKKSHYPSSLGEKALSSKLTLVDNPLSRYNPVPFDFEGYRTKRNVLIKNGVIKTFLHDSYSSRALGMKNTFNSESLTVKPSVSFFNPVMKGRDKLSRMIAETDKGFMFYDLYPDHVVDNVTGTFGLNSSTFYYIEKGEVKGVVKEGVVTGNSYEMFKNVESVSRETRNDSGSFEFPTVKTKAEIV